MKNILIFLPSKNIPRYITKNRKIFYFILLTFIVLFYLLIPKNKQQILTEKVQKRDILKTVSVTGEVSSDNIANLTFQTTEKLSWVGVKEGDIVAKGQAIASLDQTKLQASLRQAEQDFIAAKAASEQYYNSHTDTVESDSEKVQRTAIDAAQNKAYDQLLKVQYDIAHSTLYSPINGIVTRADAKIAGETITPTTTYTIVDPSSLNFKMEVDEADIGQIAKGQKINVSLDAFLNTTFNLTVDRIDFVSHKTPSGGNAFYVYAPMQKNNKYRIGMIGNAEIIVDEKQNVLSIPSSSIFDDNYVYVKKNNKFKKIKIQIGLQNDTNAQVLSGLSEGDYVALDPASVPKDKTK
jgi:RND family efflux transporter MFP subunit